MSTTLDSVEARRKHVLQYCQQRLAAGQSHVSVKDVCHDTDMEPQMAAHYLRMLCEDGEISVYHRGANKIIYRLDAGKEGSA